MQHICAWCGRHLEEKGGAGGRITHGICSVCAEDVVSKLGQDLYRFLESVDAPVVTLDAEGRVGSANEKAKKLFHRDSPRLEGLMLGTVSECAYSRLPGGCGQTRHCTACTLRNTIESTARTGQEARDVPVRQTVLDGTGTQEVHYRVSTEKVKDVIFLKIQRSD